MRKKYRSAVYYMNDESQKVEMHIEQLQKDFSQPIITVPLKFIAFKKNEEQFLNYYSKNQESQFCQRYIHPKLNLIMQKFATQFAPIKAYVKEG